MLKQKLKAFSVHFSASFLMMLLFVGFLYYFWFKDLFFITNVLEPLKLLIVVDVILGPLLTFLVYKVGKKTLKFDLAVIVLFQLAAFGYGAYSIYQGKPSLVVFNGDAFELVYHKEIKNNIPSFKEELVFAKPKYFVIPPEYHVQGYAAYQNLNYIQPLSSENWNQISKNQISLKQTAVLVNTTEAELLLVIKGMSYLEKEVNFIQVKENNLYSVLVFDADGQQIIKTLTFKY